MEKDSEGLRERAMPTDASGVQLWSIGGGKGGIGKSLVTLGLGVSLARLGKRVILIDGDLGGANLHTLMGVRYPHVSLEHFLTKKVARLEDTIIETSVEGIGLICGADNLLGSANPSYDQKMRLLKEIEALPAEYVLMDLGAGTSFNTLDFFNFAGGKITLFTSQAPSLVNAYGFIKSALYRKLFLHFAGDDEVLQLIYRGGGAGGEHGIHSMQDLLNHFEAADPERHARMNQVLRDFHLFLVINMVKSTADLKYAEIIGSLCQDSLCIQPEIIGHVPFDSAVEPSISQMMPFPLYHKKSRAMAGLDQAALRLVKETRVL
jgi:flagellar biosynthesis protein FlhG